MGGGGGGGGGSGSGSGSGSGGGGGGGSGGGGGGTDPTKNTRRRVQQKRTRNTTRPKTTEDKVKQPPIVLPKPVLESTNPFFIAVCAPDSYRPSSSSSMANHRSNSGGGNGNRRSDVSVSQRQKQNVFLRQNNRNSTQGRSTITTSNSGGSGAMNHFIHHPIIQNDRQRSDNTVGAVSSNGYIAHTDIHDKEQFPSLSSASTSTTISSEPVTKLNFKEMVLRSGSVGDSKGDCGGGGVGGGGVGVGVSGGGGVGVSSTVKVTSVPKVRAEYSQKALSSGNIFLGAFCGSSNNESMDEEDDYDETSGQRAVISSVLIDSCDRKYDNLYR
jgi:hypothetical protein